MKIRDAKKRTVYRLAKRLLDVAGAAVCTLFAAPLMIGAALAIRCTMGAPVLFRHSRPGLRERAFVCLKFRTMTDERDEHGEPLSDEARLTKLGCFLRRTSVDELPQLWNVLKGEMSLVGPRPLEFRYIPRYTPEQRRRHHVLPGITGWAQVHGRNAIDWERKFALDLWYVDHCGLRVDFQILAMTAWQLLFAKDVAEPGYATASEFWGTGRAQTSEHRLKGAGNASVTLSPREVTHG